MARRNRTLTLEQEQRRDARREQFRTLAQQIGAMSESQRADLAAKMSHVVTVEGRALSVHNMCLLACQRPDVTMVGGFNQWRTAGRNVRKGEHGLMIWAPIHPGARDNGTPSTDIAATRQPHEPGSTAPDHRHFIMVTVFDVAQTDEARAAAIAS